MPCALTDVSAGETHKPTAEAIPTDGAAGESGSPPSDAFAVAVVDDAAPDEERDNHVLTLDGDDDLHKEELAHIADADETDEHPSHDDNEHLMQSAVEDESGLQQLEAEDIVRLAEQLYTEVESAKNI